MSQLVDYCEKLRPFSVLPVNEDGWRNRIRQYKTSELADVEPTMRVVPNDAIYRNGYASGLNGILQLAYRILLSSEAKCPTLIKSQEVMKMLCKLGGIVRS